MDGTKTEVSVEFSLRNSVFDGRVYFGEMLTDLEFRYLPQCRLVAKVFLLSRNMASAVVFGWLVREVVMC